MRTMLGEQAFVRAGALAATGGDAAGDAGTAAAADLERARQLRDQLTSSPTKGTGDGARAGHGAFAAVGSDGEDEGPAWAHDELSDERLAELIEEVETIAISYNLSTEDMGFAYHVPSKHAAREAFRLKVQWLALAEAVDADLLMAT